MPVYQKNILPPLKVFYYPNIAPLNMMYPFTTVISVCIHYSKKIFNFHYDNKTPHDLLE